ncbi:hypothetical protein LOC68_13660 [Blastopirellula sp. JC732]|uniref:Uncharacterized protein n=1 Tax=Blastopirellula sediminis TaxID=2894196 RepID=A0A9X1SH55_9BACT|nr:hypothetical protein [Blastopirellula sediminis]MCC9607266.1 hypothetical protein [Blastopirellula sediminis]MCC9629441.1 hypothetical protein [Blastopirellula sediminis]
MSDEGETLNEQIGGWVAVIVITICALISGGFMPDWNVLPYVVWLAIAGLGGAIGVAIYTQNWLHGTIAGVIIGVGAVLGVHAYIIARSMLLEGWPFFKLELMLGGGLGALPGLLYLFFVANRD